jgi:hypothetical protein
MAGDPRPCVFRRDGPVIRRKKEEDWTAVYCGIMDGPTTLVGLFRLHLFSSHGTQGRGWRKTASVDSSKVFRPPPDRRVSPVIQVYDSWYLPDQS